jgi:hypothetical protein
MWSTISPPPLFDRHGVASHFIVIEHDITSNWASFLPALRLAVARASRATSRLALLFIDLEQFKQGA